MREYGLIAVLFLLAVQTVFAENAPDFRTLKNAKVGDWVEFTTVSKSPGTTPTTVRQREEIVALTAGQASIQVTTLKPDGSAETILTTIAIRNEPYGAKTTTAPLENGAEELTVGSEKFDCKWLRFKERRGEGPDAANCDVLLHTSPRVPLGGIVKLRIALSNGEEAEQRITAYGNGK